MISSLLKRMSSPLYRNSIFLLSSTVATSALGFVFWMVVARYYTEGDVGLGAAILSSLTLVAMASGMGVDTTMIRFLSKSDKPSEMINSALNIEAIAALILAGIYVAGISIWSPRMEFIRDQPIFAVLFLIFAVGATLTTSVDAILVANRRAEFVLGKNTLISLLKLALPVVLVHYFHVFGIAGSWGISMTLVTVLGILILLPSIQKNYRPAFRLHPGIISDYWRYSAGNYLSGLFGQASSLILPIMALNLLGNKQNAYFYAACMIAGLLDAVPRAISQSFLAESAHSTHELQKNIKRSAGFALLILLPVVILMILLSKRLLLLFGSNYSSNASLLLSILAFSSLFGAINSIYNSLLRISGRIKELVIINGVSALTALIASGVLMRIMGIVGIGYATLGVDVLLSIYVITKWKTKYSNLNSSSV